MVTSHVTLGGSMRVTKGKAKLTHNGLLNTIDDFPASVMNSTTVHLRIR
jgi:hypothetical protein